MVFGALPLFNACLKARGHTTLLADAGAEAFSYALRPGVLESYLAFFDGAVEALEGRDDLTDGEKAERDGLRRLRAYPRGLILECRDAARKLRDPESFYDPDIYRRADRVIRTTHAFLNSFTPQFDPRNQTFSEDLYAHLTTSTRDAYFEYYENDLLPRLEDFRPELVAMSCPFSPQVGTGLDLSRRLKERFPGLPVVMGGTGVSDAADLVLGDPRFYDYADFGIVGDGEEALPDLCDALQGKISLDDVPGLWRRDGDTVIQPRTFKNVDLDESPTPDYTDVDFSHYMLPEKAGLYTTSRGCYYGKCTFCPESFRLSFRMRSAERVFDDVKDLVERQGVKYLHFFDPLTPPATLARVSKWVAEEGLDFHWYAEVKFDHIYTRPEFVETLSKGGCRQLQFGFESGVQRVLDRMKKGNRLDRIEVILENLTRYGITMAGTWFIGFPTETEEEARESWRFWRRHPDSMHLSLYTGTFSLGPEVPVYHNPEDYGVEIVYGEDGYARCVPLDGEDWDKESLHTAMHVRSDIEVTICGAGLLYAAHAPRRLYALRNVNRVGPTSMDDPPLEERRAWVSKEIHLEPSPEGSGVLGYVAESLRTFELDATDRDILLAMGEGPVLLSELFQHPQAPPDLRRRLARLIDRGFIESRDPVSESLALSAATPHPVA